MRWKQALTPLEAVPDLDGERVNKLVANHITTAEELVGQIEAAPEDVSELLQMDEPAVHELGRRALKVSNPEIASAMERQRPRRYKLGALPPRVDRVG